MMTITKEDLEKNGFYYRVIKRKGKVILIEIMNKQKMYNDAIEAIRRLKKL